MATARGGLSRSDRLLRSRDFQRVAREGRRSASRRFVVIALPRRGCSTEGRARLGITASRRVGSAVVRNRVKRQVREWFRAKRWEMEPADLVVIARPAGAHLPSRDVWRELSTLARRALSEKGGREGA